MQSEAPFVMLACLVVLGAFAQARGSEGGAFCLFVRISSTRRDCEGPALLMIPERQHAQLHANWEGEMPSS